jgi:hypothetical protein
MRACASTIGEPFQHQTAPLEGSVAVHIKLPATC